MLNLTILSLVAGVILGAILGTLFKVYILPLAIGLGIGAIVAAGMVLEASWGSVVFACIVFATASQVAYLGGAAIIHARPKHRLHASARQSLFEFIQHLLH